MGDQRDSCFQKTPHPPSKPTKPPFLGRGGIRIRYAIQIGLQNIHGGGRSDMKLPLDNSRRERLMRVGAGTRLFGPGLRQCGVPVRNGERKGLPCRQPVVTGATVCRFHGAYLNPKAREHIKRKRLRRRSPASEYYWNFKRARSEQWAAERRHEKLERQAAHDNLSASRVPAMDASTSGTVAPEGLPTAAPVTTPERLQLLCACVPAAEYQRACGSKITHSSAKIR